MYTLSQIAKITGGKVEGNGKISCSDFLIDSRKAIHTSQTLFIALVTSRNDGHRFIESLIKSGVNGFLVSDEKAIEPYLSRTDIGFIIVKDTLKSLQQLAATHRKQFKIPVIGITGSNGKTVVKEWLNEILKDDYTICRSPKSYNSQIGVALSVLNLDANDTMAIFEAGISAKNEMATLESMIQPTIGVLTNIGEAHSEGFESVQEKLQEKLQLFVNTEKVILNLAGNECFAQDLPPHFITIGLNDNTKYKVEFETSENQAKISIRKGDKIYTYNIDAVDLASIYNSATSVVTALEIGQPIEEIKKGLKRIKKIELRLELKNAINNAVLINDFYSSDYDSIKIALAYLKQQNRRDKKILILSDIEQSGKKQKELYLKLAELIKQSNLDYLVGIGESIYTHQSLFNLESEFFTSTEEFTRNFQNIRIKLKDAVILLKGSHKSGFIRISELLQLKSHDTVLEVNLTHLAENVNHYRSLLNKDVKLMCMVKATGYGSGSVEVASTLQNMGVNYLAVAYTDEGVELREALIHLPIMVMSPEKDSLHDIIQYNLEPEIYSPKVLNEFIEALEYSGITKPYPIHIKLDTGMRRLGFEENEIDRLIQTLKNTKLIKVKSIFSHLVGSDDPIFDEFTKAQISSFKSMADKIETALGYDALKHICNSGGISRFKEAHFEMVRLGIGMYGIGTNESESKSLKSVLTLKTRISQIKQLQLGESVGYSRKGIAQKSMRIATIPIGYADGFLRKLGNGNGEVFINGKRCPTIGNICMDMCMIDISMINAKEGDEVTVFSSVDEICAIAKKMETIPYEVLTNLSQRIKRIYLQE